MAVLALSQQRRAAATYGSAVNGPLSIFGRPVHLRPERSTFGHAPTSGMPGAMTGAFDGDTENRARTGLWSDDMKAWLAEYSVSRTARFSPGSDFHSTRSQYAGYRFDEYPPRLLSILKVGLKSHKGVRNPARRSPSAKHLKGGS